MPPQPAERIVVGRAGEGRVLVDAHHPTIDNQVLEQRRRQAVASNEIRQGGWVERLSLELAKHPWGLKDTELAGRLGVSAARLETILAPLIERGAVRRLAARWLTRPQWEQWVTRVLSVLSAYHEAQPLRRGMPKEELRSRTAIPADLFAELLTMLTADHALVDQGGEIAAADHHPALTSEQETAISAFVAEL